MKLINNSKYELQEVTLPRTYKECCEVLGLNTMENDASGYKHEFIISFQELLIERDAYWKIAGEQLGLDKPWEPDFSDDSPKYNIFRYENEIILSDNNWSNRILSFPTEEMRNIFYENFKITIELCKVLL